MDRPLHDYLDGEREPDELTSAERAELAALEAAIGSVVMPLRTAAVPDLSARVMSRVAEIRREPSVAERITGALRCLLDWVWTPRPLHLRPAYGVAALAVICVLAVIAPPRTSPSSPSGLQAGAEAAPVSQVYVQFRLEAQGASQVALAGNFTDWQPAYELRETEPGTWSILVPLRPGVYDYSFVVDGQEWIADPHAFQIDDGFGGMNSRIALPSPPAGSLQS